MEYNKAENKNNEALNRSIDYENELKLPDWKTYFTQELDFYSNNERQDLICRFKLQQLYQNLCIARINFIFSNKETNYGDLNKNNENKEWISNLFLQNSLVYYNICIDLSWIMAGLYFLPKKDNDFNITEEEIDKYEKSIDYENLQEQLNMQYDIANPNEKAKIDKLRTVINNFWINEIPEDFRQIYNYVKHRGTLDIFNIEKENSVLFLVNGKEPNIKIPRIKEFDAEKYIDIIINFHNLFIKYIDDLIEILIKPNYIPPKYSFEEIITNIINN